MLRISLRVLYGSAHAGRTGVPYPLRLMAIFIPTFEPSKTALDRVSAQVREKVMNEPHGMFDYLRVNNPDHVLVSGKRPNQVGTILYGFEHLGKNVNAAELANQLGLAEKQVTNAISKINAIIYPVFGMRIERQRVDKVFTGNLRLTDREDAMQACEAIGKVLKKKGPELAMTIDSYVNANNGDVKELAHSEALKPLMSVVARLAPALPQAVEA